MPKAAVKPKNPKATTEAARRAAHKAAVAKRAATKEARLELAALLAANKPKVKKPHGHPVALSDAAAFEAQRRHLAGGVSERQLAKELGVSQSTITRRGIAKNSEKVKAIARSLALAEQEYAALPLPLQVAARSLADELKEISRNLASAARHGSATANHLSQIASQQASKIDPRRDAPDTGDYSRLGHIAAFTEGANRAADVGLRLLGANKEAVRDANNIIDLTPGALSSDPVRAAQVYQKMMRGG